MAEKIFARVDENGYIEVRHQKPEKPAATPGTRWIDDIPPAHDPATHRLEEKTPIPANAKKVPYKIVARDVAAEEAQEQVGKDDAFITEVGPKKAASLLVGLVTSFLDNGTIRLEDLTLKDRQAFTDLKDVVDRLEE